MDSQRIVNKDGQHVVVSRQASCQLLSRRVVAVIICDQHNQMIVSSHLGCTPQYFVERRRRTRLLRSLKLVVDAYKLMADSQHMSAAAMRLEFHNLLFTKNDRPDAVANINRPPGGKCCKFGSCSRFCRSLTPE